MSGTIASASMLFLALLALPREGLAMAWPGPEPTPAHQLRERALLHGRTPRPTSRPLLTRALLKRQQEPNICGYESGSRFESIGCSVGLTCYFSTTSGAWGRGACCRGSDLDNCQFPTTCIDMADFSTGCKDACKSDRLTVKCTGMSSYCHTYQYLGVSVLAYGCGRSMTSRTQTVDLTYAGQTLAPSSSNFRLATPTRATTQVSSGSTGRRSTNVGVIVGGVVSGLIVLAAIIIAVLLFLYCSRRRRRRGAQAAAAAAAAAPPGAGTSYAPGPGPAGYGPVPQESRPPMQQQQVPPTGAQSYFAPAPLKDDPPYAGGTPTPVQQPPYHYAPSGDGVVSATTPLPPYYRESYMPVPAGEGTSLPSPPDNVHQLHGQSVSSSPPPPPPPPPQMPGSPPIPDPHPSYRAMPAPNSGPIYEAPSEGIRH